MNIENLKEIKQRLDIWREERRLDYESQQKGFVSNILDELREYYLAINDDERVAELCDIVIFCLNVNNLREFNPNHYKEFASLRNLVHNFATMISNDYTGLKLDFNNELVYSSIEMLIIICINIIKRMGYNPYECLNEKIKEIESRTVYYDEKIGKFIKNKGLVIL
ncbi:hypothetical protein [Campylobacter sp. MG1]|uniref:hypothetical protein n=1 Tax=Campylobacter sp. MG1 TaxID=2976332 RepID=UPI00226CF26C|nr:hypothetical protein [Campylobacter sp. MG1]